MARREGEGKGRGDASKNKGNKVTYKKEAYQSLPLFKTEVSGGPL
jgi:hypothetical protein